MPVQSVNYEPDFIDHLKKKFKLINNKLWVNSIFGGWKEHKAVPAKAGYILINVRFGKQRHTIRKSRLVYFLKHGKFPATVDHIDRNKLNDHPNNLREVTASENNLNCYQSQTIKGKSKYLGVTWDCIRLKWRVIIVVKRKTHNLGRFDSEIEAAKARNEFIIRNNLTDRYTLS